MCFPRCHTAQETPLLLPSEAVSARGPHLQRCPQEGQGKASQAVQGSLGLGPQMLSLYPLSHTPQTLLLISWV